MEEIIAKVNSQLNGKELELESLAEQIKILQ
jgi:hypothetical protein